MATVVSDRQRTVHIVTELVSIGLIAPLSFHLAASPRLRPWERVAIGTAGAGALLVDGWLAYRWLAGRTET